MNRYEWIRSLCKRSVDNNIVIDLTPTTAQCIIDELDSLLNTIRKHRKFFECERIATQKEINRLKEIERKYIELVFSLSDPEEYVNRLAERLAKIIKGADNK